MGIVKERNLNNSHMSPPDAEHLFARLMNATTLSINSSHASLVSHPDEITQLILNATKDNSTQTISKS
ncbi:MAG: hypothetical protein WBX81_01455 [Nitrososphaeraceae archaeon]